MYDSVQREVETIKALLESGSSHVLIRERLERLFREIQRTRQDLDRVHSQAREVLLALARTTSNSSGLRDLRSALLRWVERGESEGLASLVATGDLTAAGILAHGRGDYTADYAALEQATDPVFRAIGVRASTLSALAALGHRLGEALPADVPASSDVFVVLRTAQERMAALAREVRSDSWEEAFCRLLLAEVLLSARRFDAAMVTLAPVLRSDHLLAMALYLSGCCRYFAGDRASARADWLKAANRPDSIHSQWAAEASNALSERRPPQLRSLLGT